MIGTNRDQQLMYKILENPPDNDYLRDLLERLFMLLDDPECNYTMNYIGSLLRQRTPKHSRACAITLQLYKKKCIEFEERLNTLETEHSKLDQELMNKQAEHGRLKVAQQLVELRQKHIETEQIDLEQQAQQIEQENLALEKRIKPSWGEQRSDNDVQPN